MARSEAGGKPLQGASTITQQLVRNLYIAHPRETIRRKIIEAHLANEENDSHSKDWILTAYLNTAPYGTNARRDRDRRAGRRRDLLLALGEAG